MDGGSSKLDIHAMSLSRSNWSTVYGTKIASNAK